jgi:hypothetical protein
MNVSFAPLSPAAAEILSVGTGINYTRYWPFPEPRWFCATARNDEGGIMGVILCNFSSPFEAEFNTAVVDPRCVTRRVLRAVFTALFSRVVRVSAQIAPDNTRSLRNVARMGFKLEGHMRLALDGKRDAVVFGMLKTDCRFLPGYAHNQAAITEIDHGRHVQSA